MELERALVETMATIASAQLNWPDATGRFGEFGGRFVPETLMHAGRGAGARLFEARARSGFKRRLRNLLKDFAGRPTPLFHARRLTEHLGGAQIYLKREDLLHTGAHKINNCLGQGLLAQRMGKTRLVAETGAGQHGVATATVAALLGMECVVYMGEEDMARQAPNVFRMRLLGTKVVSVSSGTKTLKDAINEGMRDWVTNVHNTHYLMGSVLGPHPYPMMVRDFHRIIGQEARRQILEKVGRLPDLLCACVGGGSNSIGLFYDFIPDAEREDGGRGGGRPGPESGRARGALCRGQARGAARLLHLRAANGRRLDLPTRTRFPRGSIIPPWDPSTPSCIARAAWSTRT